MEQKAHSESGEKMKNQAEIEAEIVRLEEEEDKLQKSMPDFPSPGSGSLVNVEKVQAKIEALKWVLGK